MTSYDATKATTKYPHIYEQSRNNDDEDDDDGSIDVDWLANEQGKQRHPHCTWPQLTNSCQLNYALQIHRPGVFPSTENENEYSVLCPAWKRTLLEPISYIESRSGSTQSTISEYHKTIHSVISCMIHSCARTHSRFRQCFSCGCR